MYPVLQRVSGPNLSQDCSRSSPESSFKSKVLLCGQVRPENEIYQGSGKKAKQEVSMFLSSRRPGNECPLESFHPWC